MAPTKDLAIAPMLHVTTLEFRHFMRVISKRCTLWTEMIVDETLAHNPASYEAPLDEFCIFQIGTMHPETTAKIMPMLKDYSEVNLNMDCPSNRVQGKEFGAILMKKTEKALAVLHAMKDNAADGQHISLKCRIGVDEFESWEYIEGLIEKLSTVCKRFTLHARKVELNGLSPAQNRLVPPLNYGLVYRICERFPELEFWINAGIPGLKSAKLVTYGSHSEEARECLTDDERLRLEREEHGVPCDACGISNGSCIAPPRIAPPNLKGCSLGRAAMENPTQFWDIDRYWYDEPTNPCQTRREIIEGYCKVLDELYPRRCCDTSEEATRQYPPPRVEHFRSHCEQCCDISGEILDHGTEEDSKITSKVVGRCIKPIHNIFFGQHNCKNFKRLCDQYVRIPKLRNCGPAFILRKAIHETIPDELLDMPLKRTEDLGANEVVSYVSPGLDWQPCYKTPKSR